MTHLKLLFASAGLLTLAACAGAMDGETLEPAVAPPPPPAETASAPPPAPEPEAEEMAEVDPHMKLAAILEAQPEDVKARYNARRPAETLALFQIEPGMTVVEGLPGGGWYSRILIPYLGPDGKLIGAHYPDDIWPYLLPDASEERIAGFIARNAAWVENMEEEAGDDAAALADFNMTTLSEADDIGEVDAILFIRALHNLHRVEDELGYYTATIEEAYRILEPGGVVGVVQHRAPEDWPDEAADGNLGYLKQSNVIADFEAAGFVLEVSSELNANPKDQPEAGDPVWRLPPSLATSEEGSEERAELAAIGESDRMTLRFRKPG